MFKKFTKAAVRCNPEEQPGVSLVWFMSGCGCLKKEVLVNGIKCLLVVGWPMTYLVSIGKSCCLHTAWVTSAW